MGSLNDERKVHILLVEDNPGDAMLVKACLKTGRIAHRVHVVEDGEAAMAFLHRQAPYADAPRPDIILLDLNLPAKSGREVLREVKADEDLRAIPVVIHTSSVNETDVAECYEQYANCYVPKGMGYEHSQRIVSTIEHFWFETARLPNDQ